MRFEWGTVWKFGLSIQACMLNIQLWLIYSATWLKGELFNHITWHTGTLSLSLSLYHAHTHVCVHTKFLSLCVCVYVCIMCDSYISFVCICFPSNLVPFPEMLTEQKNVVLGSIQGHNSVDGRAPLNPSAEIQDSMCKQYTVLIPPQKIGHDCEIV